MYDTPAGISMSQTKIHEGTQDRGNRLSNSYMNQSDNSHHPEEAFG
jgi:hypothetical protein